MAKGQLTRRQPQSALRIRRVATLHNAFLRLACHLHPLLQSRLLFIMFSLFLHDWTHIKVEGAQRKSVIYAFSSKVAPGKEKPESSSIWQEFELAKMNSRDYLVDLTIGKSFTFSISRNSKKKFHVFNLITEYGVV